LATKVKMQNRSGGTTQLWVDIARATTNLRSVEWRLVEGTDMVASRKEETASLRRLGEYSSDYWGRQQEQGMRGKRSGELEAARQWVSEAKLFDRQIES